MNKLIKRIAIGLWVVITLGVLYYFVFPASEDYRALNKALVGVTNSYLNDREVQPKSVEGSGKYFEIIRLLAVHLSEKRDVEKLLETETKLLTFSISNETLANPQAIDDGIVRADKYQVLLQDSLGKIHESVEKYQNAFSELIDDKDEMVPGTSLFRKIDKALVAKEEQAKVRLALAQHVKAMLEFAKSRQGFYTPAGNKLAFTTPEDQAYYDQIYARIYDINGRLDRLMSEEKQTFRQDLSIELPPGQEF